MSELHICVKLVSCVPQPRFDRVSCDSLHVLCYQLLFLKAVKTVDYIDFKTKMC